MKIGFGVDLGGTTVKLAAFTQKGELLSKWEIPTVTSDQGAQILPDIAASVLAYCKEQNISKSDVLGLGIGVPGPVNGDGIVAACENLGWGRVDVCKTLTDLTGFAVKAGNDATVAAVGEYWVGGGQGCKNMIMVTLGTGVGGGIVLDGKPLHGFKGAAGEIGHMVLNRSETRPCACGRCGCVEQYCSATGIARMATEFLAESTVVSGLRSLEKITAKDVFDAAKAGDTAARQVLEQVYAYMGEFIANVCIMLNPEQVVIGGGVSKAGDVLIDGIKRHFNRYVYHVSGEDVEFKLAKLGNDAGVYGAFKLIME